MPKAQNGSEDEPVPKLGGKPYRQLVAAHVAKTFAGADLLVYEEVPLGSSIIGKDRHVDILVLSKKTGHAVGLQAKYQASAGTTDEKIHYALADCAAMWIPAVVVYGGPGWSLGVRHTLEASRHAVRAEVNSAGQVGESAELDSFLAAQFGLWATILKNKKPVAAT
jgi:hypothetical protein